MAVGAIVVPDVVVNDPVAEGVPAFRQAPGEHMSAAVWVGDHCTLVVGGRSRRLIGAAEDVDQAILAGDRPMVRAPGVMGDVSEQTFGARPVAHRPGARLDRDQVFAAGQNEDVVVSVTSVVISRDALGSEPRYAGNAERPAHPEHTNSLARAVGERQFGIEPVSSFGDRHGNGEIASPCVQARREFFSESLDCAPALRDADDVADPSRH